MLFSQSLKKNYQFRFVYQRGRSLADKYLVVYKLKNGKDINRLGISVSKKVGNSVVRSRITRLIRESYRLNEEKFEKGYDIIVIARVNAKQIDFKTLCNSLQYLCAKHKIYEKK